MIHELDLEWELDLELDCRRWSLSCESEFESPLFAGELSDGEEYLRRVPRVDDDGLGLKRKRTSSETVRDSRYRTVAPACPEVEEGIGSMAPVLESSSVAANVGLEVEVKEELDIKQGTV
ncbi:hypothetical protein VTL71DRAFT_7870 [Oculimacula yallundae]|uniref:Uncharacterized protein n=1 Tax=Oculimacula yallundae TaxID=86028 RepID=A0ABR4CW81_9HELO